MDETAVAGESLVAKVTTFMKGLTEDELALFAATLPVANPPEVAPEAEGDDTAGYNLAALTSFTAPTLAPATMKMPTFSCRPKTVSYQDPVWGRVTTVKIVCGWE